jgi:hypothetical protein
MTSSSLHRVSLSGSIHARVPVSGARSREQQDDQALQKDLPGAYFIHPYRVRQKNAEFF